MAGPWEAYQSSAGPWSKYQVQPSVGPSDIPGAIPQPMEQELSFGARVSALPETMARTIYGGLTGLIGAPIALGKEILTGTPKEQTLGNIMALSGRVPVSPGAQANLETIGNALSIFPAFTPAVGQAGQISQGVNALAARTAPAMRNTVNALVRGPEPQMAGGGAALTQEALLRAERAQRQGIPLTKGEQLQTLAQQQLEQDLLKSNKPELVRPLTNLKQQQQEAIGKQFQKLTEETGAIVADVDPIYLRDIGKIVDKPLMAEYQKSFNKYKAKYADADNSGETLALVEYKPIVDFIESKSPTERATLDPVLNAVYENLKRNDPDATGNINIRTMEDIYQLTGKYQNSANARQLKNLIDQTTEGAGGNLYQEARAARRQFAKEFEDVSSVAKLVGSKGEDRLVRLSDVFDNVVLGSTKEDVQHITGLLKRAGPDGQQAINELKGQTIQWLKGQATGVNGITKFDNFRKAVDKLEREDKLTELFGKTGREQILDLRDTVKDALVKQPGAVNYSNTASALMRGLENMALRIPGAKTVAELRQDYITKKQAKEAVNFNALSQGKQNQLSP
jgi:Ca2+-binding EF-hand superfamily protein